jgi:hypothetical protein
VPIERLSGIRVKLRSVIAVAAVTSLVAAGGASSTTTGKRVGSFSATGTGTIVVQGNLTAAFGKITGRVIVRDRVGGAIVRLAGVRQTPRLVRNGRRVIRVYTLPRADGNFYVKGRNVRITLSTKAELSATIIGRGTVTRLDGTGSYSLNNEPSKPWSDAIVPIAIAPPAMTNPDVPQAPSS